MTRRRPEPVRYAQGKLREDETLPFAALRAALVIALAGCAVGRGAQPLPPLPFVTDTVRSEEIAPGVIRRFIYAPSGPWGIYVLDVDLSRCNAAIAVKGASGAAGRTPTSKLLTDLAATRDVVGGVNADFFSLAN